MEKSNFPPSDAHFNVKQVERLIPTELNSGQSGGSLEVLVFSKGAYASCKHLFSENVNARRHCHSAV